MADEPKYAVMFFDAGLKELGAAVQPYLLPGELGPYLLAKKIETGLPFTRCVIDVATAERGTLEFEVQFPSTMIKLILNLTHHRPFGFTKGD